MKRLADDPHWQLSDRQRHESYEGSTRLLKELPLVGRMHLLDALPNSLRPHTHLENYEFHLVVNGSLSFSVGTQNYDVGPNMVFMTRPGETHAGVNQMLSPAEWYWIQIRFAAGEALPGLSQADTDAIRNQMESMPRRLFAGSPALKDCFLRLLVEHRNRSAHRELMARLIFHELLIGLARDLTRKREGNPDWAASPEIQSAAGWIDRHLDEPFSVAKVARAVGLSESHFRQRFHAEMGFPPSDYVTRQRIAKAKQLLGNRQLSVTDIAFQLGFNSSAYFTAVFKRSVGQTPKQFRQTLGQ